VQRIHKDLTLLLYLTPALIWAIGIFVIISIPSSAIPKSRLLNIEHIDKVIHFLLFFGFSLLLSFGFYKQHVYANTQKYYMLYAISISVFYGGLTEIIQAVMLSSRFGNVWDFFANSAGALMGVLVFSMLTNSRLFKNPCIRNY